MGRTRGGVGQGSPRGGAGIVNAQCPTRGVPFLATISSEGSTSIAFPGETATPQGKGGHKGPKSHTAAYTVTLIERVVNNLVVQNAARSWIGPGNSLHLPQLTSDFAHCFNLQSSSSIVVSTGSSSRELPPAENPILRADFECPLIAIT